MQAHLATRLGRWDKTSDLSAKAIELERAYHKELNVKPKDDHQFAHHLEILTLSLIHDGRFREARAIKQEAWDADVRHWMPWFRLHVAERDWPEALKIVDHYRKNDKLTAAYLSALIYLRQGDTARAAPEIDVLRHAYQTKKKDKTLELRLWETQGLLMCQTSGAEAGLKLLAKAVKATIDNYSHHAWGNGAYYIEPWGVAALQAGKYDVAEEAFLEALAHDRGSLRAALGLQVLFERLGRRDEAARYAEMARRFWARAEVRHFEAELAYLNTVSPDTATKAQRAQSNSPASPPASGDSKR
jgi:tetratricopeptide (TPR) repeat protein